MSIHSKTKNYSESGSVFYIIMLGIVLFAAISTVVVQSGKGGTSAISDEKAEIYAAEIIQYAVSMSGAVRRMQMVNECADEDISFYKANVTSAVYLHVPDVATKCQVYHPDGGGMSYQEPRLEWLQYTTFQEWLMTGNNCMKNIGTFSPSSCSASEAELTMTLYGLKKEVCDRINKKLGVVVSAPPSESINSGRFNGSYPASNFVGGVHAATAGKKGYCILDTDGSTANHYTFIYAIIPR